MGLAEKTRRISIVEYLQDEKTSQIKHDYVNGAVFAMTGASEAHNLISLGMSAVLLNHLQNTSCKVFMSDMKTFVQSNQDECFFYPDIQVCCDKADNESYYKTRPKLIVEVLSTSTERFDRSEKFYTYRKLDSLEEYVLIAQDTKRVEVYRRDNNWELELTTQGEVYLASVDLTVSLDQIYQQIVLTQ